MSDALVLPQHALVLVMGVPGSGKTTLTRALLTHISAVLLDNNFIADAFSRHSRIDPSYAKARPLVYDILYRITRENLAVGNSVLLDVPHVTHMQDAQWRSRIQSLAADCEASLVVLRCLCGPDVLRRRLQNRGEERDRWKLENWDEFLRREPINVPIPFEHIDLDTERALDENVVRALQFIASSASPVRRSAGPVE